MNKTIKQNIEQIKKSGLISNSDLKIYKRNISELKRKIEIDGNEINNSLNKLKESGSKTTFRLSSKSRHDTSRLKQNTTNDKKNSSKNK